MTKIQFKFVPDRPTRIQCTYIKIYLCNKEQPLCLSQFEEIQRLSIFQISLHSVSSLGIERLESLLKLYYKVDII